MPDYPRTGTIGNHHRVPIYAGARPKYEYTYTEYPTFFESEKETPVSYANERNINLTNSEFETWEEFYSLVAGRCSNAVLHLTPAQTETVYHFMASRDEWKEPNILPADYRITSIKRIVVVED